MSFEQCCGQSAMETLPPPRTPPPSILEALEATWVRTPAEVIDSLISTCVIPGNFQKFNQDLDYFSGPGFAQKFMVIDLRPVMVEAIKRDSTPFVSELLRRGLPMCPYFATEAVCSKSKSCLEVFLQQGWDINEPAGPLNPPVLGHAINDEDMTRWLLDRGADPNQRCRFDVTPLSYAAARAPVHIIQILLDHGGDIQQGEPLQNALDRENDVVEVVRLFHERGAPLNQTMYKNHPWSWRLFLTSGLGTPLHKAAKLGKLDAMRYLLSQGADTSIQDWFGHTAMDWAKQAGQLDAVKILEDANA